MSVPENQRTTGKLNALVKARMLCTHTFQITSNENVFNPKYERLVERIIDAVVAIYQCAWNANDIRVTMTRDGWWKDAQDRLDLQKESIRRCKDLIGLIEISRGLFHLRKKKVEYWMRKANEARESIAAWSNADRNRYNEEYKKQSRGKEKQ